MLALGSLAAVIGFLGCTSVGSAPHAAGQGDWIDVHVHLFADKGALADFDESAREALRIMDAERIRTILIMSPPRAREGPDTESLAQIVRKYRPRIAMLGGGGTLNPMLQEAGKSTGVSEGVRQTFEETAEHIIASGAKGFGELTAHHLSLAPGHAHEAVSPDHPLLRLLADIAARHDVPIDLHLDPVPSDIATPANLGAAQNPPVLKANVEGFERLLAHNRKARIVWAHCGWDLTGERTVPLMRSLLERHPNLYMSIKVDPSGTQHTSPLTPDGLLRPEWVALLRAFPDRFMIGSDQFLDEGTERLALARRLVDALPTDIARLVASENARRIFRVDHK